MMDAHLVLDASVAGKWFLHDESETAAAFALKDAWENRRVELHVPGVFHAEVCQLLAKACGTRDRVTRLPRMSADTAAECIGMLYSFPFTVSERTNTRSTRTLALSTLWSKRFYDMAYLALAEELDCRWITADDKVLQGTASAFPAHRVLLLSALAKR